MASSENQGLQFALIILFILMIVLSLTTFIFFKDYQEAESKSKKDAATATEAVAAQFKAEQELQEVLKFIGLKEDIEFDAAKTSFETDMTKLAGALPKEKQFYRMALEETLASLNKTKGELADAQDQIKKLDEVNAAFQKSATEQVTTANAAKDKALADLQTEQAKFMEAQQKSEAEKKDLLDQVAKAQQEKATEVDKVRKEIEVLQKKVKDAEVVNREIVVNLDRVTGKTFTNDDGEIRQVDQRSQTVWINLGRVDGLRPQVTFTVHRAGVKPGEEVTKASIEVTRILADHMAECRILEDNLKDPIVPGDRIYTPLWDPGHPEHFAIIGRVDFDGDDRDDRDQLRSLIAANGGIIDAEVAPEEAKVTGKIGATTRYLIRGPIGKESTRTEYDGMVAAAKQFGADTISVEEFLDSIGWRDPNSVVRFGHNSNVQTYRQPLPDGGLKLSPGSTSDLFRKRRPGEKPIGSAY